MNKNDEMRYISLRKLLDKEHYLEPFEHSSLELIERLINDLITLKKRFQRTNDNIVELNKKNDYLILGLTAYKNQNIELFKQNKELHCEIISLTNQLNYKGKDIELSKLSDEKESLRYLLSKSKKEIELLNIKLNETKNEYLRIIDDLYNKNVDHPAILEEVVKDYKLKLDPKLFDYERYEKVIDINSLLQSQNISITNEKEIINPQKSIELKDKGKKNRIIKNTLNKNEEMENSNDNLYNKCKELKQLIIDKDKEIELLRRNIYSEHNIEQKVIIDELEERMKNEKAKYESYIHYLLKENGKLKELQNYEVECEKNRKKKFGIDEKALYSEYSRKDRLKSKGKNSKVLQKSIEANAKLFKNGGNQKNTVKFI